MSNKPEDDADKILAILKSKSEDTTNLAVPDLYFKWVGWILVLGLLFFMSKIHTIFLAFWIFGLISMMAYFASLFGKVIETLFSPKRNLKGILVVIFAATAGFLASQISSRASLVVADFHQKETQLQPLVVPTPDDDKGALHPVKPIPDDDDFE